MSSAASMPSLAASLPSLASLGISTSSTSASLSSLSPLRRSSIYGFEDRVVLDIGSLYLKCGLSGESRPRYCIPFTTPLYATNTPEISRKGSKRCELYSLEFDMNAEEFRRRVLADHLRAVYSKYLLTDPKQRKVIIIEGPMMPVPLKRMIARILFLNLQVPAIAFLPSSLLSLVPTGKLTGLVVDCGNLETTVVPVFDGRPMIHCVTTTPHAGAALSSRLRHMIRHHASTALSASVTDHMIDSQPQEFWEDLKARLCFACPSPLGFTSRDSHLGYGVYDTTTLATNTPWRFAGAGGGGADVTVVIPGWIQERAAEVIFEDDGDGSSLASIVLDAIMKCPVQCRSPVAANIILAGGTSMLPGFQERLQNDVQHLLEESKRFAKVRRLTAAVKFANVLWMGNCLAWIGGSVIGAVKSGVTEVTRDAFLKDGVIPDWTVRDWGNGGAEE